MTALVFDIETDAIAATKIWGVSIYNMNTGKINSYYQDELTEGIKKFQEADKLIGHNISPSSSSTSSISTSFSLPVFLL